MQYFVVLFLFFCKVLCLIICVFLSVAFVTLYERKLLGYVQIRKGPNKVGYKGLFQPFSDAVKLFVKELPALNFSNYLLYVFSPAFMLWLMMIIWLGFPSLMSFSELKLGVVYVLCCLSVGVYPALSAGWVSNSKYPLLGALRASAQTISYEVSMVLIFLSFIVLVSSYSLDDYLEISGVWLGLVGVPLMFVWMVSMLAELNRTPFDLAEGESELVSGFNTEFSGGLFALLFLAEYGSILFMGGLFVVVFLGGGDLSGMLFVKLLLVVFGVIWARGVMPRIRYDGLMMLAWKVFLPISLFYLWFFCSVFSLVELIM